MNTTVEAEWQAAYDELLRQKPLLNQYVMDQVYDKMINEEGWIAPYYAGDGKIMMDPEEGNTDIDFFVPEGGTNLFVDAMCILKGSQHKAEAEAYINFLCRTDVAKANAEYIGYSTPRPRRVPSSTRKWGRTELLSSRQVCWRRPRFSKPCRTTPTG